MSYCWGAGSCGQLGLGEEAASGLVRCRPGPETAGGRALLEAACGERHTLLLRPDGTVCSCGDNSRGQLGRKPRSGQRQPLRSYTPEQIQALEAQIIVHVSCGKEHSLSVCNRGKVFSWGAGSDGQLGTGEFKEQRLIPKKIDGLSALRIIQVTCGHYHSMALAQDGRVFSWGQNSHGQLGLGKKFPSQASPQHVTSLNGIPLAQVAAGGTHSFALSLSGVVYGWGRNNARQLGLNHANIKEKVFKPYSVAALKTIGVIYVSCGDEHTAVLTQDGSVFTFGDDSAGQLGHRFSTQMPGPQKVEWLDGPVSHLACGSYHTLVYMSTSGQIISFGRGPQRHIENGTASNQGEQTQNFDISSLVSANDLSGVRVKMIFAGTYVNFVNTLQSQDLEHARGSSSTDTLQKISRIDRTLIDKWMAMNDGTDEIKEAKREIAVIFSSPACLNASFLKPSSALEANCVGVDLQKAREVFDELAKKEWIANTINSYLIVHLIPGLPLHSAHQEALSIFLLLAECFVMFKEQNLESFVMQLARAINSMSDRSSNILEKFWSSLSASFLDKVVQMFKKAVVSQLPYYAFPRCRDTKPLLEVLEKLYRVNKKANYTLQLSNFYIDEISSTFILQNDVARWRSWQATVNSCNEDDVPIIFCRFPFIFNLVSKIQVFHFDSFFLQESAKVEAQVLLRQNELLRKSELPEFPVFPLQVKRSNLVEDTLRKLSHVEDSVLKKQLLVQFEGELRGLDAGGVTLEFFLYLFEEMVNPQYGMFMYCDPASPMWFPTSSSVEKKKYFLFGILCGLSLFNRVIAFIPFPLAIFKKLLDKKPSLEDLKELNPVVGKSLQAVLDYEYDDIEENLQIYYCVSWDNQEVDLIPDGSSIAVNNTNKKDFVNKYVDYIFNKSVEEVYEEFKRGFYKVLDREILRFFQPQELMEVAIGNTNYDWNAFEKNAVYWGIYTPSHPTIRMFWKVFHELTLAEKKGFSVMFLTGSDRIPVMGMDCIKIKFNPHVTLSEDHIPEAQTCFHILILPQYSTIEKLREKLLLAISNNQGFGKN
ncbi:probable E3 ubiquitin-protein ligase HERC6 [Emydura macquarii macquarii]|uniref:probable E3 ubiquitin-protein ligase HERC6 n=1 Tax=Emydura macquarii macquarii TaxID=1129001 RepID=UPI00352ACAE1